MVVWDISLLELQFVDHIRLIMLKYYCILNFKNGQAANTQPTNMASNSNITTLLQSSQQTQQHIASTREAVTRNPISLKRTVAQPRAANNTTSTDKGMSIPSEILM